MNQSQVANIEIQSANKSDEIQSTNQPDDKKIIEEKKEEQKKETNPMDAKIMKIKENMEKLLNHPDKNRIIIQYCDGTVKTLSKSIFSDLPKLEDDPMTNYLLCLFWDASSKLVQKYATLVKYKNGEWYNKTNVDLFIPIYAKYEDRLLDFLQHSIYECAYSLNTMCIRQKLFDEKLLDLVRDMKYPK